METYRPTVSQQLIWLDQYFNKGSAKYNIGGYAYLDGALDYSAFNAAIRAILFSQEAYASLFIQSAEGLVCGIDPSFEHYIVELIDFSKAADPERDAFDWMKGDFARVFESDNAWLFCFKLLKINEQMHFWYAKMHHLISDGWSFRLLLNQTAEIYSAYCSGQKYADIKYKYSEYSADDYEYYHSKAARDDMEYWLREYAVIPGELIPRLKEATMPPAESSYTLRLSAEDKKALNAFSAVLKVSLFQLFIGLLLIYFGRTRRQSQMAIGVPVLNRTKKVYRNTSGVFMNLLAIKFGIDDYSTLEEVVKTVKERMSGALRHQRYQYGNLARDLKLAPNTLLYDIRVSYEDFEFSSDFGGLKTGAIALSNYAETDKLAIYLRDYNNEGFDVRMVYNTQYLDDTMIRSIGDGLQRLIAKAESFRNVEIGKIDLLDEAEQARLIRLSVGDVRTRPVGNFMELWERSCILYSGKTAVSFEGGKWTYYQLNEQATALAATLRKIKCGGDTSIALLLPRSEKMVVGILASIMAGLTYIPLDVETPDERIRQMLESACCRVILVYPDIDINVRYPGITKIEYENHESLVLSEATDELNSDARNDACYIIFTSGSTGIPKGVVVSHASVVDYIFTFNECFQVTDGDVMLQQASFSFDVSVEELFPILSAGGRLHIWKDRRDLASMPAALTEGNISMISTTPLVMKFLNQQKIPASIRVLISGGDVLKPEYVDRLIGQHFEIYNTYGPTEATVCATYYRISGEERRYPIGKPIYNKEVYILDNCLQLQPSGVEGEIYLAGSGLALGYINDPTATEERFQRHFSGNGERMYRTGDLGLMMPDGNVVFTGRRDGQLSFRGYRIESAEIEKRINETGDIEDCIVTVKTFRDIPVLAAFLKYKEGVSYLPKDWRVYLEDQLPAYMIPTIWVVLDELPLLPSGKINKQELPEIREEMFESSVTEIVPPESAMQIKISGIWQEILGHRIAGIHDSFFDLGGHSLNIMQLMNAYSREFDVRLTVRELFDHTTIFSHEKLITGKTFIEYSPILHIPDGSAYAVSDGQRRMWVLSQIEVASRAYQLRGQLDLSGRYSVGHFERAVNRVIDRHEVLRTVFRENEEGELRQVVLPPGQEMQMRYEDLEGRSREEVLEYINQESWRTFDLSNGPLVRGGLIRLGEERYIFHFTMHHIISDGWSMELLAREVFRYYDGYVKGEEAELPPLRIQYRDYAAWQQGQLKTDSFRRHRDYWLDQFSGELPVLELPSDHVRPAAFTHNGYVLSTAIGREQTAGLRRVCRENNATLFMGLLAVLKALLYRYTGQQDIIIGSPVAGRDHAQLEDQIGFYINTVALRTRFESKDSFEELLGKVREVTLSGYEHQAYPFDHLVEELDLKRDMSRSALFDVMIILQNQQVKAQTERGEDIVEAGSGSVQFDICFDFAEHGEGIWLDVQFNTDIYEKGTVRRLVDHYKRMLEAMILEPGMPINQIDYLAGAERHQLLEQFNDTRVAYRSEVTIADLIEEQAARTPENIAVVFEGKELTYRELDERSNQLAHYLRERGVREETMVPICVDRSPEMVIGILGILKAGGAFVPLDPNYPTERIAYILSDIHSDLIITGINVGESVEEQLGIERIYLDIDREEIKKCTKEHLEVEPDENRLAYIIHTSGSTGKPKGVMITHRSLTNFICSMQRTLRPTAESSMLACTTISFDIAYLELFLMLVAGGKVIVMRREDIADGIALAEKIRTISPTYIQATPTTWQMLLECGWKNSEPITIITGGEAIHAALKNQLLSAGNIKLWNLYGPTETTIWSAATELEKNEEVSIGKPISNTQLYILDNNLNLLPVGVAGEIYIGGAGLARGYLNNEELTTEKFVGSPFRSGERLYRTGDIGRWLESGSVECRGRGDNQVKIRGHRVEPGEVEHALLGLEGIDSAAVVARARADGSKQLVAYLVSKEAQNSTSLRQGLLRVLPEYMVPGAFVQLEKLPLTANGKVDRRALPSQEELSIGTGNQYVAPRNATEKMVGLIYQEVLRKERISVRDNFFEIGGSSILLVRIRMLLQKKLKVHIQLQDLYHMLTIEETSEVIDSIYWLKEQSENFSEQGQLTI
jgi:amino acid adenylation domain-containing protein